MAPARRNRRVDREEHPAGDVEALEHAEVDAGHLEVIDDEITVISEDEPSADQTDVDSVSNEITAGGELDDQEAGSDPDNFKDATSLEDDADPTEDDARYAHIEGIRVPIVVTGQPWTEAEIEAFIEITARVGGSPYRAAGLFEEHTSRSRAASMGMYRRLLAEGRMERSERSRHRG